jgi:hypothetical protein
MNQTPAIQPVALHYTDWAMWAPKAVNILNISTALTVMSLQETRLKNMFIL